MEELLSNYISEKLLIEEIEIKDKRLILNINKIRDYNNLLSNKLIKENIYLMPILEEELIINKKISESYQIGFKGSLGKNKLNPRSLNSTNIGQLISINGIITKISKIRPKMKKSVHYKSNTSNKTIYNPFSLEYKKETNNDKSLFFEKEYRDSLSISKYPQTTTILPKVSSDGMLLNIEQGMSIYYDYQIITIQELPESSPIGVMPVSLDIILTYDLCDKLKPGDRPIIYGTLKALTNNIQNSDNSIIRTVLLANNIELNKKEIPEISYDVLYNKYANHDFINNLHKYIAPSIYGNEKIKRSILLQLISHYVINDNQRRSTINILLVGDPSTAKSQMLRYILNTAELSVSTTGRGSSGVGLTASVVISDDGTNDRMLAAGALVIADGGVCCIDEFDKMSHFDRIALHEAMEQGTVSISKAGIHATLNSRTCVLAAANPILGSYNDELSIGDNLGLEMSLISRFDVIWILKDKRDPKWDYRVSNHILNLDNEDINIERDTKNEKENKSNVIGEEFKDMTEIQIQQFIKEHIRRAKTYTPILLKESADKLIGFYTQIRKTETQVFSHRVNHNKTHNYKSGTKNFKKESNINLQLPVTPRLLDSLIRLATNNARLHLRNEVTLFDAEIAIEIIKDSRNIDECVIDDCVIENIDDDNSVKPVSITNEYSVSVVKKALLHFKELGGAVSIESIHEFINKSIEINYLREILRYLDEEEDLIMFSGGLVLFLD